jgi:hypothetical protein
MFIRRTGFALLVLSGAACSHVGAPADGAIPVSSYLFTPELGSYVPLVVDVDLRELATQNPEIKLAPCAS